MSSSSPVRSTSSWALGNLIPVLKYFKKLSMVWGIFYLLQENISAFSLLSFPNSFCRFFMLFLSEDYLSSWMIPFQWQAYGGLNDSFCPPAHKHIEHLIRFARFCPLIILNCSTAWLMTKAKPIQAGRLCSNGPSVISSKSALFFHFSNPSPQTRDCQNVKRPLHPLRGLAAVFFFQDSNVTILPQHNVYIRITSESILMQYNFWNKTCFSVSCLRIDFTESLVLC